jgi:hypothetical protein
LFVINNESESQDIMNIEEPTVVTGDKNSVTTHPAFGQINACRVNGSTNLYGSDFTHDGFITITVNASELNRDLSQDRHHSCEQLIQLSLSEAQWATFVSSLNNGSGVPCTLGWLTGKGWLPRLPNPKSRADQFGKEFQQDFDQALTALDELEAVLHTCGLSKKKIDDLVRRTRTAKAKITSSAPFVVDQFANHMEAETERAKVEIHGYIQNVIQRAGVSALVGPVDPITLTLEGNSGE